MPNIGDAMRDAAYSSMYRTGGGGTNPWMAAPGLVAALGGLIGTIGELGDKAEDRKFKRKEFELWKQKMDLELERAGTDKLARKETGRLIQLLGKEKFNPRTFEEGFARFADEISPNIPLEAQGAVISAMTEIYQLRKPTNINMPQDPASLARSLELQSKQMRALGRILEAQGDISGAQKMFADASSYGIEASKIRTMNPEMDQFVNDAPRLSDDEIFQKARVFSRGATGEEYNVLGGELLWEFMTTAIPEGETEPILGGEKYQANIAKYAPALKSFLANKIREGNREAIYLARYFDTDTTLDIAKIEQDRIGKEYLDRFRLIQSVYPDDYEKQAMALNELAEWTGLLPTPRGRLMTQTYKEQLPGKRVIESPYIRGGKATVDWDVEKEMAIDPATRSRIAAAQHLMRTVNAEPLYNAKTWAEMLKTPQKIGAKAVPTTEVTPELLEAIKRVVEEQAKKR